MTKQSTLSQAIKIATDGHYGQFDRGGKPYILHPMAVMHILGSDDEELNAIAIMHDLVEDCPEWTIERLLLLGFSDRIIEAVDILSKFEGQTYEEYKNEVFSNEDAMRVKLADLTHNSDINRLKGVRQKDLDRMKRYHEFYLEIKEKLHES